MRIKIINDLRTLFRIIRTLFSDAPKVLKNISEDYEETLYGELKLIPTQFDENILDVFSVAKIIIKNINFDNLLVDFEKQNITNRGILCYNLLTSFIDTMKVENKTKAIYKNFLLKFKPLCICIDKLTENPIKYLKSYNELFGNKNDLL